MGNVMKDNFFKEYTKELTQRNKDRKSSLAESLNEPFGIRLKIVPEEINEFIEYCESQGMLIVISEDGNHVDVAINFNN